LITDALQSILTIVIMVSTGYFLTARGWFDDDTAKLFSRLVVKISLPVFLFSNLYTAFDREELVVLCKSLIYPALTMIFMYALGLVFLKLLKTAPGRKGIFLVMFSFSNTVFIGLPVNVSLFGEASVPYVVMFYTVNTLLFWTIGINAIKKDDPSGHTRGSAAEGIRNIVSPPLVAFLISIVLIALNIPMPRFVMDTAGYLGSLTTPLSMLFMGITIYNIDLSKIRIDREMIAIIAGRFLIAPVIVYLLFVSINIPLLMKKVFIIEAAMPVMVQCAIVAKTYGADYKYATIMVAVTTIVGMAFIPVYMLILGGL